MTERPFTPRRRKQSFRMQLQIEIGFERSTDHIQQGNDPKKGNDEQHDERNDLFPQFRALGLGAFSPCPFNHD